VVPVTDLELLRENVGVQPLADLLERVDGVHRVDRDNFGGLLVYYESEATAGDVEAVAQLAFLAGYVFTVGAPEALHGWHRFQEADRVGDFDGWPGDRANA
jgi:hypothetical protein